MAVWHGRASGFLYLVAITDNKATSFCCCDSKQSFAMQSLPVLPGAIAMQSSDPAVSCCCVQHTMFTHNNVLRAFQQSFSKFSHPLQKETNQVKNLGLGLPLGEEEDAGGSSSKSGDIGEKKMI
ncbi:hypothetical protein QQP08_024210 [Theobroma cacao]|nr:hypothetical protein QQP08_024210 [Theobroma cacao]